MTITKESLSKLDEASEKTFEVFGIKPSDYIDECEIPFLFGFQVAVCARIQQESLKRMPQNGGILSKFMRPPVNPIISHRMLIEAVDPHKLKISKYFPESNRLLDQIDGLLANMPSKFDERGKLLYLRGKMAGGRMYADIYHKREKLKKAQGLSEDQIENLITSKIDEVEADQ